MRKFEPEKSGKNRKNFQKSIKKGGFWGFFSDFRHFSGFLGVFGQFLGFLRVFWWFLGQKQPKRHFLLKNAKNSRKTLKMAFSPFYVWHMRWRNVPHTERFKAMPYTGPACCVKSIILRIIKALFTHALKAMRWIIKEYATADKHVSRAVPAAQYGGEAPFTWKKY